MKIISNKLTVCIVFSFLMLNSNAIKAQEKLPYQNSWTLCTVLFLKVKQKQN